MCLFWRCFESCTAYLMATFVACMNYSNIHKINVNQLMSNVGESELLLTAVFSCRVFSHFQNIFTSHITTRTAIKKAVQKTEHWNLQQSAIVKEVPPGIGKLTELGDLVVLFSANAVSHLNHINTSNIRKSHVSQQLLTWRLQWYSNMKNSLQT